MGTATSGPTKRDKSYQVQEEGECWQRSLSPERLEDDYGKMDSAFMEKQTPGGEDRGYFKGPRGNKGESALQHSNYFEGPRGNKGESAPRHSKPSVRRMRREEFELDWCREERDRAHIHDSQNRAVGIGPGYATTRGQGPLHHGASTGQWGSGVQEYGVDMEGPATKLSVPTYR